MNTVLRKHDSTEGKIRPIERWINLIQIFASICLAISCFLPQSMSQGRHEIYYVSEEWSLFFWPIPVIFILYKLSNRWLKAIFCVLSSIGGLISLVMLTFLANFKHTPLVGFHIARTSIVILVVCWLILSVITLTAPKIPQTKTSVQTRIEKLLLDVLLWGFAIAIAVAIGWIVVMKIPVLHAQYVQRSDNPEIILDTFFHALVKNDLDLAKELVAPALQKRLDEWAIESQHTALDCFRGGFLEMYASSSRPNITYTTTNQAVSETMVYECIYGDRSSISLWGTNLEYNGREWLITNWTKICKRPSKLVPPKCYP